MRRTWLSPAAVCALQLLFLEGCSDDDASPTAFADYWADSTEFCQKSVECEFQPLDECTDSWPTKSRIREALELARLDDEELGTCMRAARASDTCQLKASCETIAEEETCASQVERVRIDCASFLAALEIVSKDDDVDSSETTPTPKTFGDRICERLAECSGEIPQGEAYFECVLDANESFASLLPAPLEIAACIAREECASLKSDGDAVIQCLGIDPETTRCVDDRMLHACNRDGDCTEIDCFGVCGAQAAGMSLCGFSESNGFESCDCGL